MFFWFKPKNKKQQNKIKQKTTNISKLSGPGLGPGETWESWEALEAQGGFGEGSGEPSRLR